MKKLTQKDVFAATTMIAILILKLLIYFDKNHNELSTSMEVLRKKLNRIEIALLF